jgi:hypothetical protein
MTVDMRCDEARVELSARLDDEVDTETASRLDDHLRGCAHCRAHYEELASVRRALRTQLADEVPNLVPRVMDRVSAGKRRDSVRSGRVPARREWSLRLRIAGFAAAIAAVVAGVWLPGTDTRTGTAAAAEVTKGVRTAARALETYEATFAVVERGWHARVDRRRFSAKVQYRAPASFSLRLQDQTSYPGGGWPANDVELIANARGWWIDAPSTCPPEALPGCPSGGREERSLVNRQPFDGTVNLPTDLIYPLQTLADSSAFEVVDSGTVNGRAALKVTLPYRQALPLVMALQAGGSWREFHPLDRVELWIDESTWFPLRFDVIAGSSEDRRLWARRQGYEDGSGETLLQVRALRFATPEDFAPGTFSPPQEGTVADGGFAPRAFSEIAGDFAPQRLAGLSAYRAGAITGGQELLTYTNGMEWLKVIASDGNVLPSRSDALAEEVRLDDGGWAYYEPATDSSGRRLHLYGADRRLLLETNLPRTQLLSVAGSIRGVWHQLPRKLHSGGATLIRVAPNADQFDWTRTPKHLPRGYKPRASLLTRTAHAPPTLTTYYRGAETEFDGLGVRVTQARDTRLLPPSSEEFLEVPLGRTAARWSPQRMELEWIEDDTYLAVSTPSFDLSTALRIARGLR